MPRPAPAPPDRPAPPAAIRSARVGAGVLAAAVVLAVLAALAGPANAQATGPLYIVHGLPGAVVDLYLDGDLLVAGAGPGDIAGPVAAAPGPHRLAVLAAADAPPGDLAARTDDPLVDTSFDLAGDTTTALVVHPGGAGRPTATAFVDDRSPTAPGEGRVTIRNVSAAGTLDVVVDGATVPGLTGIEPGGEATVDLEAGDYPTAVAPGGTAEPIADAPLIVRDGQLTVVYAVGAPDAGTFELLVHDVDDDGMQTPPAEIAAGDSGLRAEAVAGSGDGSGAVPWLAGTAAAALAVGVLSARGRLRRRPA